MSLKRFLLLGSVLLAGCPGSGGSNAPGAGVALPAVSATSPFVGATAISTSSLVLAGFNQAMKPETLTVDSFRVYKTLDGPVAGAVTGTVGYDVTTRSAVFTPDAPFLQVTEYTATLGRDIMTSTGKNLDPEYAWNFTTADETPPNVNSTFPVEGTTGVGSSVAILIEFSEPLNPASLTVKTPGHAGHFNFFRTNVPNTPLAGTIDYVEGSNQVIFHPTAALLPLKNYTMNILGVEDVSGNATTTPFNLHFTTADFLTADLATPLNEAIDVPLDTAVSVTFNNAINTATVNSTTFSVSGGVTTVLPISFANGNRTATFMPSANLAPMTAYSVTLAGTISDMQGNSLGAPIVLNFTTGSGVPSWATSTMMESGLTTTESTGYQIAQGANGDSFAIWHKGGNLYANRMPHGGSWETPVLLNQVSDGPTVVSPAIAADGNGNAMAVWAQGTNFQTPPSTGLAKAFALKYIAGSGWQSPSLRTQINQNTPVHSQVRISMNPSGYALIIWRRWSASGATGEKLRIAGKYFAPAAGGTDFANGTFSPSGSNEFTVAANQLKDSDNLQVAIDSSSSDPSGIAIWTQTAATGTPTTRRIFANRFSAGAWPTSSVFYAALPTGQIPSETVVTDSMRIKMDAGGNAIAVWSQGPTSTQHNIWAVRFTGTTWGGGAGNGPLLLESQANDAQYPQVAINNEVNGDAVVVWEQFDGSSNANNIYFNKYTANTNAWMANGVKITTYNPNQAALPAITNLNAAGDAFAVWREKTTAGSVWQIFSSRYTASTSTWSSSVNLCSDNVNDADISSFAPPQIVAWPNQVPAAFWSQAPVGSYNFWATIYR